MTEMKYSQTSVYKSLMFARNGLTISTIAQYHVTIVAQRFPRKTGHHCLHRINKHFTSEFQIRNQVRNKKRNKQSGGVMLVYLNGVRGELHIISVIGSLSTNLLVMFTCLQTYRSDTPMYTDIIDKSRCTTDVQQIRCHKAIAFFYGHYNK